MGAREIEGKIKILLHQLLPQANLAAGCTSLFVARAAGADIRWLAKPRGAKVLVAVQLPSQEESEDCVCSVHARKRAMTGSTPPPGWPRAAGSCVLLDGTPGTIHAFDCAVHPLYVRLSDVDVAGLWSYAAVRAPRTYGFEVMYNFGQ